MTPKEKAIDIYTDFMIHENKYHLMPNAKEMALISVNILINDYKGINKYFDKYYKEVRRELKKL